MAAQTTEWPLSAVRAHRDSKTFLWGAAMPPLDTTRRATSRPQTSTGCASAAQPSPQPATRRCWDLITELALLRGQEATGLRA